MSIVIANHIILTTSESISAALGSDSQDSCLNPSVIPGLPDKREEDSPILKSFATNDVPAHGIATSARSIKDSVSADVLRFVRLKYATRFSIHNSICPQTLNLASFSECLELRSQRDLI